MCMPLLTSRTCARRDLHRVNTIAVRLSPIPWPLDLLTVGLGIGRVLVDAQKGASQLSCG